METEFRLTAGHALWPPPPLEVAAAAMGPGDEIDLLIDRMSSHGSISIDRLIADSLRLPFAADGAGFGPRRWLRAIRRRLPGG